MTHEDKEIRIYTDRRTNQEDRRKAVAEDSKPKSPDLASQISALIRDYQERLASQFQPKTGGQPPVTPARQTNKYPTIYVFTVNGNILETVDNVEKAFRCAERLRTEGGKSWTQTRPGRWYATDGTVMEI